MPEARAHHYLPIFYLKGFTDRTAVKETDEGILWVYSKDKPVRKSKPLQEAHQQDLYSFTNSVGDRQNVEEGLSKIESDMAPIVRTLADDSCEITAQDAAELAAFTALMWVRGPSTKNYLDVVAAAGAKAAMQKQAEDPVAFKAKYERLRRRFGLELSADDARAMILSDGWELTQNSPGYNLKLMFNSAMHLIPILTAKAWDVLTIPEEGFFCTSDNPVVTLVPEHGEAALGAGFGTPGVEVYFPLDSRNCFVASDHGLRSRLEACPAEVQQINEFVMLNGTRFAYARENSATIDSVFKEWGCKVVKGENAFLPPRIPPRKPRPE
jgi:hypothetical protein